MAINSKTYDYLSRFCAEGMEKAHEEMRKEGGKGMKNPLRGLGKGGYKFYSSVDAMLTDLFERRLCMSNGGVRRQLIILANPHSLTPDEQDPELTTKLTTSAPYKTYPTYKTHYSTAPPHIFQSQLFSLTLYP